MMLKGSQHYTHSRQHPHPFSPFWSFCSTHETTHICQYQLFNVYLRPQKIDMKVLKGYKRAAYSLVMLVVLAFNTTATTLFIHSHIIDGKEVVHSHPYSGPVTSHSHTKGHILAINEASHWLGLAVESLYNTQAPTSHTHKEYSAYSALTLDREHITRSMRAPPVLA